jgi:hypothetical protein
LVYHEKTKRLFAQTANDSYEYDFSNEKWAEIPAAPELTGERMLSINDGPRAGLLTVSEGGIFYYPLTPEIRIAPPSFEWTPEKIFLFRELIAREPSFREFQEAVIRYNDLGDGKIRRWQIASRLRALLPSISFGKDFTSKRTIDVQKTSTYSPIDYITGPDDTTAGWDLRVSWSPSDLIYNTAQTSIDSRSKIDAEFRKNLLAEVVRVYYERRRTQMEIISSSELSEPEYLERLVRLDELTSRLDTFSGGYFSARLESIYRKNPELNGLWIKA